MAASEVQAILDARKGLRRTPDGGVGVRRLFAADGVALVAAFVGPVALLVLLVSIGPLVFWAFPESVDAGAALVGAGR